MRQVPETVRGGYRKLGGVVQARIEEPALAVHFKVGDKGIPMRDRAPAGPRVKVHASKPEGWRNQRRARHIPAGHHTVRALLRIKCLAVQDQFRVEFTRSPTAEHGTHRVLADTEQTGNRAEVRSKRHDSANIEIAVGPAIQPVPDASRERVIDRRMAQGTLDADRDQMPGAIEEASHPHHRIEFQQRQLHRRPVRNHAPWIRCGGLVSG